MFTGLIREVGEVVDVRSTANTAEEGLEIQVDLGSQASAATLGASIALSGVCCTATQCVDSVATFFLSPETLDKTWLGEAEIGRELNLEPALCAGEPLGGHLVQGHVDGVGLCLEPIDPSEGGELWIGVPEPLQKYCVSKGSITVDGVSLTIMGQDERGVGIAVIPHTAQATTLGRLAAGTKVHLEVDVLAKYVETMLAARGL
ncbi:MAG: riboflavin synthase [Planctomycetota bacterium]